MSKLPTQNVRLNELRRYACNLTLSRYLRPITKHFLHQRRTLLSQLSILSQLDMFIYFLCVFYFEISKRMRLSLIAPWKCIPNIKRGFRTRRDHVFSLRFLFRNFKMHEVVFDCSMGIYPKYKTSLFSILLLKK
jgi:hypothetical protein